MRGHRIAIGLMTTAVLAGCDRKAAPPAGPGPATRVSATTQPVVHQVEPASSAFVIDGQSFTFPAAKVVTKPGDSGLRVTLFSDDPPEAVRDGYQGNSFYFRFTLDADTVDLAGQQFVYRNSFTEQDDATSGLFIAGGRQTLRPVEASILFEQVDHQLIARVAGTFKLLDEQTTADVGTTVKVAAMLEPAVGKK